VSPRRLFPGSDGRCIHDELYARALVLSDGETTLGLVTCDLIDIPVRVIEAAKERIKEQTGIPPDHVLISSTHTHTAPSAVGALSTPDEPAYAESLIPRIADAMLMAVQDQVPAEAAHASGNCTEEVHNRRWRMADGSVRMNPGYENPDALKPAGPTDPQLGLLVIRELTGRKPVAVYANLALHYVGTSQQGWVSGDYFSVFGDALQRMAGGKFVASMANGCQGDINNCDFTRPARRPTHAYGEIERVGNVVAAEAWKQWNLLREDDFKSDIALGANIRLIPFRARRPTAEELSAATELYESGENWGDTEWVYAREIVLLNESKSEWDIPVQVLRIGDLGIVGMQGEVFAEVGLDVKARSPMDQTMVVGLANGSVGYVATDRALDEGSYETRLCRHVRAPKGTAGLWADTSVELLEALTH
jgi:neutral ceramidase